MYCCTRRHNTTTVSNFASDVPLFICNSIVLNIEHSNRRTACCSTVCSHNRIASHRIASQSQSHHNHNHNHNHITYPLSKSLE